MAYSKEVRFFVKNSAVNVLGGALASFLSFLFNFVVVKLVSKENYGEYMSAMAYVTLLTAPLSVISLIIIKKISRQTARLRPLYLQKINRSLAQLLRKSFVGSLLILPILWWWLDSQAGFANSLSVWLVIILIIFMSLINWLTALLAGLQFFTLLSWASILAMGLRFVLGWAVLSWHETLMVLYLLLVIITIGQFLIYYFILKNKIKIKLLGEEKINFSLPKFWRHQDFLLPLVVTLITTSLINLDLIVIKKVTSPEFAGEYSVYALFAKILFYASLPLINVAYTFFNSAKKKQDQKIIFLLSTTLIVGLMLVLASLYALWPEFLIKTVSSSKYLSLTPILFWSAFFGGIYALVMLLSQFLVAHNQTAIFWGLLVPILQAVLLYFFHHNLLIIMSINIALVLTLSIFFLYHIYRHAQKTL